MDLKRSKALQSYFSYLAYLLSGFFIFNPLFSSGNIFLSLFISFITSLTIFEVLMFCFLKKDSQSSCNIATKVTSIICASLSSVSTLILITEIIRSVAFITNRYVSLMYYIAISVSILFVSLNLCFGKEKGIYRFCTIASVVLIITCLISVFSFISCKSILPNTSFIKNASSAIKQGILSGLFITSDTAIYFFAFSGFTKHQSPRSHSNVIRFSFISGYCLMGLFSLCLTLIFSDSIISEIKDPSYSLIKLIPGIDFTELLSCARICSFMIKSSVYIYTSSKLLSSSFKTKKSLENVFISLIYLSVPLLYLTSLLTNKRHQYGAFQEYIYMFVCLLSLLILLIHIENQKKKQQ